MSLVSDFNSQNFPFPFYAALIMHRGKIISEEYFEPFTSDSLHRMFSITKSYTALAVCALAAEGKISLHDPIIKWFADMTPEHPHPYLSAMTVQDMLDMRTCHASTTYKINMNENWVRSFFITPPDHRSGQIFKYDTSSSHTLAALVKRISGKGVLDYLRTVFPKEVQISEEAHILKNRFGDEIGGSGLTAKPSDLLHTAEFLLAVYNGIGVDYFRVGDIVHNVRCRAVEGVGGGGGGFGTQRVRNCLRRGVIVVAALVARERGFFVALDLFAIDNISEVVGDLFNGDTLVGDAYCITRNVNAASCNSRINAVHSDNVPVS